MNRVDAPQLIASGTIVYAVSSTVGGSATTIAAAEFYRMVSSVALNFALSSTATAVSGSGSFLPANSETFLKIDSNHVLSTVCANGSSGSLYLTPCRRFTGLG